MIQVVDGGYLICTLKQFSSWNVHGADQNQINGFGRIGRLIL